MDPHAQEVTRHYCADMAGDFDALVDEWIADELEESPVRATQLGIDGSDELLGDHSAAGHERRDARDDAWLQRLNDVDESALSFDQLIDLSLLQSTLTGRAINRSWLGWKRDPGSYPGIGLQGVFFLFLNRVHPEPDLARFAIARMNALPAVLEEGKKNIDASIVPPLFVER
ncbi:MAG: hypothetical protein QOI61_1964, partial [Actinomycetota bacterium]